MQKGLESLKRELATLRAGRAHPGLVEHLKVEYYGVPTPLNQVASIAVPEAQLLLIQPWDKGAMGSILKAIQKSDLGLNPQSDGASIRLVIPPLTEERRREMVRQAHKRTEEGRVALRNIRRDALEELRRMAREKTASEDEENRAKEQLQKITDSFIASGDELGRAKEAEIMEV
ncbi:MAG: ribosome recycling factor [Chloroflexi bacterium]|nr:ribosome recycling factor [Chloroflexota bacterium]